MTIPNLEPMTQAEFDAAKEVTLDPIPCLRCGRMLMSPGSIVRGYGITCAFLQALEELSHGQARNPDKGPAVYPKETAEFYEVSNDLIEVVDHRNLVIGELRRSKKGGAWSLILWGKLVDIDMELPSAKRRMLRILDKMGR
jgi:hypothetical protein